MMEKGVLYGGLYKTEKRKQRIHEVRGVGRGDSFIPLVIRSFTREGIY